MKLLTPSEGVLPRQHTTKTDIVVAVVRIVVVPITDVRISLIVVPGTATHTTRRY